LAPIRDIVDGKYVLLARSVVAAAKWPYQY